MNSLHLQEHVHFHMSQNYPTDALIFVFARYLADEKNMSQEQAEEQARLMLESEGSTPEEQGYPDAEQDKFNIWYYINIMLAGILKKIDENTVDAWTEDLEADKAKVVILEDFNVTDYDNKEEDDDDDILSYNNWLDDFKNITDVPIWIKNEKFQKF